MKEYKMVKQAKGAFKGYLKDEDFIQVLNQEARGGWKVVSVVSNNGAYLKAILERDKS
ncbi:hypothetical protein NBRC110019_22700 [Neptunitalea chrysea]|uniref:DUF4177 domain-containing protein n=1 Tax=Neptunitalea chrysea TaxID=1647581 RepID=A0A9W6B623_9FLAO|nr:DUF4177 domain-containing protein [Neptunitalea chrysea]GLB53230.1 hypothetical protein NBRC110019_22700 [Neptunitalea chrysea]